MSKKSSIEATMSRVAKPTETTPLVSKGVSIKIDCKFHYDIMNTNITQRGTLH